MLSVLKLIVPIMIIFSIIVVSIVSTKRDSKYFHGLSKLISPVSVKLLPAPPSGSGNIVENFTAPPTDNGWQWYQPELVSIEIADQQLQVETLVESVWYQNKRGPMLFRYLEGDGDITVNVKTRKASDLSSYPDIEWQFGGIIFRNPSSDAWFAREDYVFNVIGHRKSGLQVELKSTKNGYSDVSAFDWPTGDAQLKIQRRGAQFNLFARPIPNSQEGNDNGGEWQLMGEYTREDFPSVLQVGLIVYSYSAGRQVFDLNVQFDQLLIETPQSGEEQ